MRRPPYGRGPGASDGGVIRFRMGAWQFCWWFFWEIKFKRNRIGRLALPSVGLLAFWPTGFRLLPG